METLRSLLFLTEADLPKDGPVALEDLVKYFPSKHSQAIEKLWGTHRLTYKGEQFFEKEGTGYGPVYEGADECGQDAIKKEEVNIKIDPTQCDEEEYRSVIQTAEDAGIDIPEFEMDVKIDEMQEVYLGYNPKTDRLWIGYDCWADHNEIDEEIDEYINSLDTGDYDRHRTEELHNAVERAIMEEMKELGFFGGLVELKTADGVNFEFGDVVVEPGGFYRGIHSPRGYGYGSFKRMGLIDLRLD